MREKSPVVIAGPRWRDFLFEEQYTGYVSHGYLADDESGENIWRSRINLGFVSHLNEDDIGHKCIEIAACGQFLLATRMKGHEECFEQDQEAAFFSSVEECADKARFYLNRPDLRDAIGRRAREPAVRSGYDNDTQLANPQPVGSKARLRCLKLAILASCAHAQSSLPLIFSSSE